MILRQSLAWLAGIIVVAALFVMLVPALARWQPEYAELPQAQRDWYASRTLTPAAEARFRFHSCCNHADVVRAYPV